MVKSKKDRREDIKGKGAEIDSDENGGEEASGKEKISVKKSAFALLNMSDDDSGGDSDKEVPLFESDDDVKPTKPQKGKTKKAQDNVIDNAESTQGKKSKKSRKKRNESVEDIDSVLAELELEYSGVKPKPENNKETLKKGNDEDESKDDDDDEDEGGTVKTAAQKKKEKKERQKREAALSKNQPKGPQTASEVVVKKQKAPVKVEEENLAADDSEQTIKDDKKKKDKKKDKGKVAEEKKKEDEKARKGPSKGVVAAMQEHLRKMKEEEERIQQEEEEKERLMEEAENLRLEQARIEQEKKDKKKQKEKERKERLKAEGKLLSNKQRLEKMRAQAMLDALKAQGVDIPEVGEKRVRLGTRLRPKKKDGQTDNGTGGSELKDNNATEQTSDEKLDGNAEDEKKLDDVKEAWDESSSEDEMSCENTSEPNASIVSNENEIKSQHTATGTKKHKKSENDTSSDSDSESDEMDEEEKHLNAERRKIKVQETIQKRRHDAEQKRTVDNLRAAVVCVLGHVDTGKTKILDKLRRTNVQDGEAGGITQQIGATNVPIENIKEQTRIVRNVDEFVFKLPGLLIIDTPGHESFSNLRNRGSSLCDIAILVVDIMHGLEPQTIESINLLKTKRTPFVVALNKVDRLYDWQTMSKKDVRDILKGQQSNTQLEFQQRSKEIITQFAEQGLNAALFYDNPDPSEYISLVPTSAITGEGMGNILFLIVEYCQNVLAKRLMYSEELLATVLEVKAIPGLGTTIDAILINGKLREGETMIIAGTDGPIVTQIRSLLMPQPMKELRVKNAYIEHREIQAAQGVKIAAKDLEKAIAGLNLHVAYKPDEVDILREEVSKELKSALSSIKLSGLGVYVQASTLGSLEALLEFLKASKIPYSAIRIGPVVKRDVMKASTMLEHESQYATILAFDVKIERDAQELADSLGVKIFQADIIYHLFDHFMAYRDDLKKKKRDEFKSIAVFPCKLRILPQFIFNSRDPIVMGVMVEAGIVKEGTPICVPTKEFVELGIITSVESNHKQVEVARKGMEVCIKIEPIPGEAPKMFGRHFEVTDMLVSKISRQSIDACKEYFRDDLVKADWALMVELKKQFEIL